MVIYGKNAQDKINSLQGTVVSALQKIKKREEIRMFSTVRVPKRNPKIIAAKITLLNGKEASIDFKPELEFDFDSVSRRIKDFLELGK